jgi:hypothetical protein
MPALGMEIGDTAVFLGTNQSLARPHFLNAVPGSGHLEPLPGPHANALVCIGPPEARDHLTAALRRCIIGPP